VPPTPASENVIRFGLFEADLSARELRKRGRKIPLQDQPFRVLTLLVQRPGELILREEFQRALWPRDTFVEFDEGLNKAIQKLRQALDDSSDNPRFIETLPRKGYRFIAPVTGNGTEAAPEKAQPPVQPSVKRPSTERLAWLLLALSIALVVFAGIYFRFLRPPAHAALKTVPLTTYPGRQITPALSPDGKQVAFAWDGEKGENLHIYVKLVDAGTPLRLTNASTNEFDPAWSPDGRYIAFCRYSVDRSGVWIIPALGGVERKLGDSAITSTNGTFCGGLSWSPDGKYLAVRGTTAPQEPYGIFLFPVDSGTARRLTSPPKEYFGDWHPRFSPDGKTLAFVRHYSFRSEVYLLPLSSDERPRGEPRKLTSDERSVANIDWTADGRRIVYSSGQDGKTTLFAVPSSGGIPEPVPIAGENPTALSVSRTSSRLVYERDVVDSNIWRLPGPNSSDKRSTPARFIASSEMDREPQYSPDGSKVVFASARSGAYQIWVSDQEGHNPVQLTSYGGEEVGSPRWSPDSRWIAYDCSQTGNLGIYIINAEGGQPRRLTGGTSNSIRPSWSRDGRWIYFSDNVAGDWQIWKMPVQGGSAIRVTKSWGFDAFESADGKTVYYDKPVDPGVWKVETPGGEEIRVLVRGGPNIWALASKGIAFFEGSVPSGWALKFYDFTTGKTSLLRQFPKEIRITTDNTSLTVSPDGRWILYTQFDQSGSNLMLVENFR
jgi:Tol biopolymer transport system component/DNA-binding winged helix-turn-helix (wHTH) protein